MANIVEQFTQILEQGDTKKVIAFLQSLSKDEKKTLLVAIKKIYRDVDRYHLGNNINQSKSRGLSLISNLLFDEELDLAISYKSDDITYDVNFAHVIEAFEDVGFELLDYETQARALVRFGIIDILDMFRQQTTPAKYLQQADKIKTLLAPTVMGDRFKMVHFRK